MVGALPERGTRRGDGDSRRRSPVIEEHPTRDRSRRNAQMEVTIELVAGIDVEVERVSLDRSGEPVDLEVHADRAGFDFQPIAPVEPLAASPRGSLPVDLA